MKLKTSNKLLLGYVASLLALIAAFMVFGFTNVKYLPEKDRFSKNAVISREVLDEFSVLHISGNTSLHLNSGDAFEIIKTTYPNDSLQVSIDYSIRNDTCFVTHWKREGMSYAKLNVAAIKTVIVENNNKLYIDDFDQDKLSVFLYSGKLEAGTKLNVENMELVASEGANARLHGSIANLQLDGVGSEIQVYNYLESISGKIQQGSLLNLFKGVGKLDFEKSTDSRLSTH
jgi:hypothetical protein